MEKLIKLDSIPEKSCILTGFSRVDYQDAYSIEKQIDENIEDISQKMFRLPSWMIFLFKIRNFLVKPFGLKTGKIQDSEQKSFFILIEKNENEIVMGESDRHLDFRTSIFIDKSRNIITLITLVHFHNFFEKLYFFPIKPFHKIIIKNLLKKYF